MKTWNRCFRRAIFTLTLALALAWAIGAPVSAEKEKEEPPKVYGVQLPPDSELLHEVGGSASFRVPDYIESVEKNFRKTFEQHKNVKVTTRTIGDVHIVIFEDRGHNPWSTIQITGAIGRSFCYLVINKNSPASLDGDR